MPFQQAVQLVQAYGVPGEIAYDGPKRVFPWTLASGAEPNVVGSTWYTVVSEGVAQAGGTTGPAGFLCDPKAYALYGTAVLNGALNPSLVLPNEAIGQLATMGIFVAVLTTAAAIDDPLQYNTTTGAMASYAAGGSPSSGFAAITGGKVILRATAANGLAIIQLTQP